MPYSNAGWPTIWGFDLSELSFSAFSSKKMFDKRWHLRRERFGKSIIFATLREKGILTHVIPFSAKQSLTKLLCSSASPLNVPLLTLCRNVSLDLILRTHRIRRADISLFFTDEDLQDHIEDRFAPAHLYNNDIIDMEITTIVFCVFVVSTQSCRSFFKEFK